MALVGLELSEVERQLAAAVRARPAQTRATTMNLICCAEDRADADWLAGQLGAVAGRHPGRMFLIVAGGLEPGHPRGEWRARILPLEGAGGAAGVCGELIELQAAGVALLAASNAVTPLLVGHAPTFLWWRGDDPVDNPRFNDLARIADRVLFDSQRLASEPARFLRLARRERSLHPGGGVCDLTWQRLARWRRLIAQGFEAPEAAAALPHLERVRFGSGGDQPALNGAALLLAGWLASRLDWRVAGPRSAAEMAMRTADGRDVVLEFAAAPGEAAGTLLGSVELLAGDFAVCVSRRGKAIQVEVGGGSLGRSTATFPTPTPMEALAQELDVSIPDPLFQQAWSAAAEILSGLGVKAA
ncbi:MAG: glucose-6-phosphate dehydrogenase assembly protein OpcA [Terriglobales bacterium]